MELGETVQTRARRAQRVGQQWAGRIAGSHDEPVAGQDVTDTAQAGDPLDRGAVLATEVFDRMGFGADDGHPLRRGERRLQCVAVGDSAQVMHTGQARTGHLKAPGRRTRRQQQLVVAESSLPALCALGVQRGRFR